MDSPPQTAPRLRFSRLEIRHLAGAVLIMGLAFSWVLTRGPGLVFRGGLTQSLRHLVEEPSLLISSFIAVGSGFVLHELAHKVVAQRYGYWAEFRAQFRGLGLTIALVFLTKILFAAPGAVVINGPVTSRENGIISLAGPVTNILIAIVAFPFGLAVDAGALLPSTMRIVVFVNALLAVFNMLPLGPLDGTKVWRWSRPAYVLTLATALGLFAATVVLRRTPFA